MKNSIMVIGLLIFSCNQRIGQSVQQNTNNISNQKSDSLEKNNDEEIISNEISAEEFYEQKAFIIEFYSNLEYEDIVDENYMKSLDSQVAQEVLSEIETQNSTNEFTTSTDSPKTIAIKATVVIAEAGRRVGKWLSKKWNDIQK